VRLRCLAARHLFRCLFVIVLFFLAVLVFLRVGALAEAFLRLVLVLVVAFFLVAIKASLDVETAGSVPNKKVSHGRTMHIYLQFSLV
jgi:hypothetical protein